jgi:membrane associated rhomboid family serine protease
MLQPATETTTLLIPQWLPHADNIHTTMPTSASFPQFSPQRLRSYILRLPLITRIILVIIIAFWIAGISHGFQHWAQLIPSEVVAGGMHRINTYPLLHLGLIHTVSNLVALAPLLERFEAEHGSLVTLILFTGRMYTLILPYCLI